MRNRRHKVIVYVNWRIMGDDPSNAILSPRNYLTSAQTAVTNLTLTNGHDQEMSLIRSVKDKASTAPYSRLWRIIVVSSSL